MHITEEEVSWGGSCFPRFALHLKISEGKKITANPHPSVGADFQFFPTEVGSLFHVICCRWWGGEGKLRFLLSPRQNSRQNPSNEIRVTPSSHARPASSGTVVPCG